MCSQKSEKLIQNMESVNHNGNLMLALQKDQPAYFEKYKALFGEPLEGVTAILANPVMIGVGRRCVRFGFDSLGHMGMPQVSGARRHDGKEQL